MRTKKRTTDALRILQQHFVDGDPLMQAELAEARVGAGIARQIRRLRKERGLTQGELARLVGTSISGISRLENEEYEGHSVATLQRVAGGLGVALRIDFVDEPAGVR